MTPPHADDIADCVLSTFERLPDKRKPRPRNDAAREWVPLAGIVLSKGDKLSCVSIGTGMKCLPLNKLSLAKGTVLHDWHAEVLAIRAFNRFILDECLLVTATPVSTSNYLSRRSPDEYSQQEQQPFAFRDDVLIHMYCSEAPCGDASMELVMNAQEDATPWTNAPPIVSSTSPTSATGSETPESLRGRSNFSLLGAVRCKPSRPDAPPTLSKSCTDKITLKQATSLLSSTTALLVSPRNAYLDSLVLPASQLVSPACERAFSRRGRLRGLSETMTDDWGGGYRFHSLSVTPTCHEFEWSRRGVTPAEKALASNLSAVWTPAWQETLIGGVLQGRKQVDPRGASKICRRSIWKLALQIAGAVGAPLIGETLRKERYADVKRSEMLAERRKVKNDVRTALKGWALNTGDENFSLEEYR